MKDMNCGGCPEKDKKTQQKQLEEMMKKRVKSADCPYKGACTQKVLKEEAELMCMDHERSQETVMVHVNGHHIWEMCKVFHETKQEREGKLPKDW